MIGEKLVNIGGNETTIYVLVQIILVLAIIILFILFLIVGSNIYIKLYLILIASFILIFDKHILSFWGNVILSIIFKRPNNLIYHYKNILFSFPQIKLIHNMKILSNIKFPVVYLANYPITAYDYLIQGFFPDSILIIDKFNKKYFSPIVGNYNKYYLKLGKSYDTLEKDIVKLVKEGKSIFAYIENSCKPEGYKPARIRSGLLHICKNNNIPIVLVISDHFYVVRGIFPRQNFRIKVSKPTMIKDVDKTIEKIKHLYDKTLTFYKVHKLDFKYKQVINI